MQPQRRLKRLSDLKHEAKAAEPTKKKKSKPKPKQVRPNPFDYTERIRQLIEAKPEYKKLVQHDPGIVAVINTFLSEYFGQMCAKVLDAHRIETIHLKEKERRLMPEICLSILCSLVADAKAERKIKKWMPKVEAAQE